MADLPLPFTWAALKVRRGPGAEVEMSQPVCSLLLPPRPREKPASRKELEQSTVFRECPSGPCRAPPSSVLRGWWREGLLLLSALGPENDQGSQVKLWGVGAGGHTTEGLVLNQGNASREQYSGGQGN